MLFPTSIVSCHAYESLSRSLKPILQYALFSLIESMKNDPDMYGSIICPDTYPCATSTPNYADEYRTDFFTSELNQNTLHQITILRAV
jgi:hypothetical protein